MGGRTVALAGLGALTVVVGVALVGVGLLVAWQTSCAPSYEATVQPADAVADPPDDVVGYETLSTAERRAFDAARENADRSYPRSSLANLSDAVVVHEGDRYVTRVVRTDCPEPGTWLYLGGGGLAIVGITVLLLAGARYTLR